MVVAARVLSVAAVIRTGLVVVAVVLRGTAFDLYDVLEPTARGRVARAVVGAAEPLTWIVMPLSLAVLLRLLGPQGVWSTAAAGVGLAAVAVVVASAWAFSPTGSGMGRGPTGWLLVPPDADLPFRWRVGASAASLAGPLASVSALLSVAALLRLVAR